MQQFVDRVQSTEARGMKDFTMSLADARALHADFTRLLIELRELRERSAAVASPSLPSNIEYSGGTF
jgi:hypothetical protein